MHTADFRALHRRIVPSKNLPSHLFCRCQPQVHHGTVKEDRGSRFQAHAAVVADEAEAMRAIDSVKTEYSGATHNMWALRIGSLQQSDDDGEA